MARHALSAVVLSAGLLTGGASFAQSVWGLITEKDWVKPRLDDSGDQMGMTGYSASDIGVSCIQLKSGRSSWRGSLNWTSRDVKVHYDQTGAGHLAKLSVHTDLLMLYWAARIRLLPSHGLYAEIAPVIGYRLAQRQRGIEYTANGAANDTRVIDDSSMRPAFTTARLRCGLGYDMQLADRWVLLTAASLGWGGDEWVPGYVDTSWDLALMIGLHYRIAPYAAVDLDAE